SSNPAGSGAETLLAPSATKSPGDVIMFAWSNIGGMTHVQVQSRFGAARENLEHVARSAARSHVPAETKISPELGQVTIPYSGASKSDVAGAAARRDVPAQTPL